MNVDSAVIVALGGNLALEGRPVQAVLEDALRTLEAEGFTLVARSRWWRSAAWPDPTQPPYLNGVVWVETPLQPRAVLDALMRVEAALGRRRSEANAARTVDLDLIAYGRLVRHEEGLTVPHPRAAERLFVMGPLADIAPDWRHPVLGETAAELAKTAMVGADAEPFKG
jgi:2-amino-4-hydroxy-6-hydroxymethyldihydropteridine diphosphokinase